jgi:hypothetical protein
MLRKKGASFMGKNYEQFCNCAVHVIGTDVQPVYMHIHMFIFDYPDNSFNLYCKQNPSCSKHIVKQARMQVVYNLAN